MFKSILEVLNSGLSTFLEIFRKKNAPDIKEGREAVIDAKGVDQFEKDIQNKKLDDIRKHLSD